MTKNFATLATASAFAFGLGIAALPSTANAGFLEQLFGGAPQPAPEAPLRTSTTSRRFSKLLRPALAPNVRWSSTKSPSYRSRPT